MEYRLPARRWLAVVWALFAWALSPLVFAAATPAPLAVAMGIAMTVLLVLAAVYLLRPPAIVRLDDEGLAFDRTTARWEDLTGLELQETLVGRRLQARVAQGRSPRLLQAFVPTALDDVVAAVLARRNGDVGVINATPTGMARFRRPVLGTVLVATLAASLLPHPRPRGYGGS